MWLVLLLLCANANAWTASDLRLPKQASKIITKTNTDKIASPEKRIKVYTPPTRMAENLKIVSPKVYYAQKINLEKWNKIKKTISNKTSLQKHNFRLIKKSSQSEKENIELLDTKNGNRFHLVGSKTSRQQRLIKIYNQKGAIVPLSHLGKLLD